MLGETSISLVIESFLELERDCFLDQVIHSLLTNAEGLESVIRSEFQLLRFQVDSLCLGMVFYGVDTECRDSSLG